MTCLIPPIGHKRALSPRGRGVQVSFGTASVLSNKSRQLSNRTAARLKLIRRIESWRQTPEGSTSVYKDLKCGLTWSRLRPRSRWKRNLNGPFLIFFFFFKGIIYFNIWKWMFCGCAAFSWLFADLDSEAPTNVTRSGKFFRSGTLDRVRYCLQDPDQVCGSEKPRSAQNIFSGFYAFIAIHTRCHYQQFPLFW